MKDKDYTTKIKHFIKDPIDTYTIDDNNANYNDNDTINVGHENSQFTINDQLLLEIICMMIRGGGGLKYSSRKIRETKQEEFKYEKEIKEFEKTLIAIS